VALYPGRQRLMWSLLVSPLAASVSAFLGLVFRGERVGRRFRLLVAVLFVGCFGFFYVLQPLILLLLSVLHSRRCLSEQEKGFVGASFADVTIVERPHFLMRPFFGGAVACAIGETLYLFDDDKKPSADLLRHEW
jgi:hypothetical protein